jgi:cobalt-zinc-cadmium efflux system outer membrane protein
MIARASWWLALALTWFATLPVGASPPLRLREVLDALEGTHPTLESATQDVEAADGRALAARGGFDPMLSIRSRFTPVGYYENAQVDALVRQPTALWGASLYAGYRIGWGTYPVYRGELATLSGGEVRAGLELPLWKNGPIDPRRAEIRKTKARSIGARKALDATRLRLERDAANAYWTWVAAGQNLHVARDLLAIAQRRADALAEQAGAGAIERIAVVDNRRLVLDRTTKLVAAERRFAQASLQLSLFLRDRDRAPLRVGEDRVPTRWPASDLEPRADDEEIEAALKRRPDIAALEAERKAKAVDLRLARNQRAPDVRVGTFVAKDLGDGPAELLPVEWGVGVVVEMPLALREARGALKSARAELAAIDAELRAARDAAAVEIRSARVVMLAARESIALAREQLAAAHELADAERAGFREGSSDLVAVNIRELAAADAASLEIEALAEYERARVDYLVATGRGPGPRD